MHKSNQSGECNEYSRDKIIWLRALGHREFQAFLSEIYAEYGDMIYNWCAMAQFSSGSSPPKPDIDQFWREKRLPIDELSDPVWLAGLGFLTDITEQLNVLTTSLQGKDTIVSQMYSHMKAFAMKLCLRDKSVNPMPHTFPLCRR